MHIRLVEKGFVVSLNFYTACDCVLGSMRSHTKEKSFSFIKYLPDRGGWLNKIVHKITWVKEADRNYSNQPISRILLPYQKQLFSHITCAMHHWILAQKIILYPEIPRTLRIWSKFINPFASVCMIFKA